MRAVRGHVWENGGIREDHVAGDGGVRLQLRPECDVPVCVIFQDESSGVILFNNGTKSGCMGTEVAQFGDGEIPVLYDKIKSVGVK